MRKVIIACLCVLVLVCGTVAVIAATAPQPEANGIEFSSAQLQEQEKKHNEYLKTVVFTAQNSKGEKLEFTNDDINNGGYYQKCLAVATDKQNDEITEIHAAESSQWEIRSLLEVTGYVAEDAPRLTLEKAKEIAKGDASSLWQECCKYAVPDGAGGSGIFRVYFIFEDGNSITIIDQGGPQYMYYNYNGEKTLLNG